MRDWRDNLVQDEAGVRRVLEETRRIAVVGIKPEYQSERPAFYVPAYLKQVGYEIVPVPTYFPDLAEILGEPVYRAVADVPGEVDMVLLFRRSADVPPHVPDILAKRPRSVWMQAGIRHEGAARELAEAGIQVVQDRCTMIDHRRLLPRR